LPHGPLPCKSGKTWAANSCPDVHGQPFANICYALRPHKATIVLPDFARSFSAEQKRLLVKEITLIPTSTKAGKGLSEKRAKESGLCREAFF